MMINPVYPQSWLDLPPTREEAKALELPQYFPPETCATCGCRARHYVSGGCVECKRRRNSRRSRARLLSEEAYAEQRKADRAKPSRENPEKLYGEVRANQRVRGRQNDQLKRSRRPPNQSETDRASIRSLYAEAKRTRQSVDHSPVALLRCHPIIVGLHVPGNIRLISSVTANKRQPLVPMTDAEAAAMVEQRLAVWRADVNEATGEVDWSHYGWATA